MTRILAIGGAHIDRTGRLHARHITGASNPGAWQEAAGGGVFNAARNLARLGHAVTLVSLRGGDAAGEQVAAAAEDAGIIDCPITFLDRATASYTAILEPDGNLVTALADMAIYDLLSPRRIQSARFQAQLDAAELLLFDCNLRSETLLALSEQARARNLICAAIAISPVKVMRLRPLLDRLDWLFMNAAEANALARPGGESGEADRPTAADDELAALCGLGLKGGTISRGPQPLSAFNGQQMINAKPPPLPDLADVTGAGDALAAGFIDAYLTGAPLSECTRRGMALARLTLGVRGPVVADLTRQRLDEAVEATPQPDM
ncbi:carbohydrate kinase family protein [Pseudohoeflea coraliihabitans]|uniref:Carbohydrate kinase family protein n=1 Tax=Pseudohoeflea coraliihabitans TaxID=2860393 RepID=A0ABS6WQ30_9HYPH|nr:carbohydrate kinase family protein [Pseudohoeflea sp. DP4N28-3]MBW3098074.1 carbohydrate kinase family protein [Pseudohoeflea sp. DP4N28-3]